MLSLSRNIEKIRVVLSAAEIGSTMVTDMDEPNRKVGRPKRGEHAAIPWDALEKDYINGVVVQQLDDGSFERKFPSIRDLADKYDVHRSLIGYHSRRHAWPARRAEFQLQ